MHRLSKAARLTAVIVGLLAVLLAPVVAEARVPVQPPSRPPQPAPGRPWTASADELARTARQAIKHATTDKSCTGWRSDFQPPDTIRVLRTHGPDTGHVETVDFRTYVGWVLSTEWTSHYPLEALKVGAIAVKQYAWFYTIVYRGGVDADGNCYDVMDNTNDQYYDPDNIAHPRPGPNKFHLQAIAATWNISLRKFSRKTGTSRLFLTGYRSGTDVPCGQDRNGFRLFQRSIYNCAVAPGSLPYEQILRLYLNPNLEVVNPGAHDVIGAPAGDVTALAPRDDTSLVPRIYESANLLGTTPAGTSAISVASTGLVSTASADMNGDGLDDLVTMTSTGETSVRIDVALSDGTADYAAPTTWWESADLGEPVADAQLLPGDYDADGHVDIGILLPAPDLAAPAGASPPVDPQAQLIVVPQRKSGLAGNPQVWWTGSLDLDPSVTKAWAADVNGDGATDLLTAQDASVPGTAPTGVHFAVALSAPPTVGLGPLATWYDAPDLPFGAMIGVVGDINRDGLDDLFVAWSTPAGPTRIDVIKGNLRHPKRSTLWTASAADPMPLRKLKIESLDINLDGISDLVLFRDGGADGTTLVVLRGRYKKLTPYVTFTDATLVWSTATPY